MGTLVIIVSAAIKAIALLMVVYTFFALSSRKEPQAGVLTKYFLVKQRYALLRMSLIFIAALIAVELATLAYGIIGGTHALNDVSLLLSDLIFLGLVVLLTKIYQLRAQFGPKEGEPRR